MVVKWEKEMRPAPPHFPWNLDTDLNLKLCWPNITVVKVGRGMARNPAFGSPFNLLRMNQGICERWLSLAKDSNK